MNIGNRMPCKSFLKKNFQSSIFNIQFLLRSFLLIILYSLFIIPFNSFADDFPPRSSTLVTDYAGVLNSGERNTLEQKLVAFNDSTSTQVAVVMMKSVGGYDISDYAAQLFNKWKIGQE